MSTKVSRRPEAVSERQSVDFLIIGGGHIGMEMSETLTHRGLDVTVIEKSTRLMSTLTLV